jgi:hypothetical protein
MEKFLSDEYRQREEEKISKKYFLPMPWLLYTISWHK